MDPRRQTPDARLLLAAFLLLWCFPGCSRDPGAAVLHQTAPIRAILAGVDDGEVACGDLHRLGDFGIGTFDGIDGEMILVDGVCWQAAADGRLYRAGPTRRTPWAAVTRFLPQRSERLPQQAAGERLDQVVDHLLPPDNRCHAIRIDGRFAAVKVRSFPRQQPPYPRLATITDQQQVYDHVQIDGTLIGFRMPGWSEGVSVPGYHFHFIDRARTVGGHVLAATLAQGDVAIMDLPTLQVAVPRSRAFAEADLVDRGRELDRVERK